MHQSIIEEDEPVYRESSSMLQGQPPIAAFTDKTPLWLSQGILQVGLNNKHYSSFLLTDCVLRSVLFVFHSKDWTFLMLENYSNTNEKNEAQLGQ